MEISIEYRDSLSDQNQDKDKYSLVLANPPFKGSLDAESVSGDLLKVCKTKKTELLFLVLFLRIMKIGGRAAVIVPDGVLFGSSRAHKAIRKELIENHKLNAVISMPSGVFKPYAGVSTAILIFTKTEHGGTDHVWFYDMKADGFSLDDKRTPVAENDIPDIIRSLKGRIHFAHVRNLQYNGYRDFQEAAHLSADGSMDMYEIMKAAYETCPDTYIRPDHGRMIWNESGRPGYGLYDRALGATYLNGLWEAICRMKGEKK